MTISFLALPINSKERKNEAAEMVLDAGQSVPKVCELLGIGRTALRRWVEQVRLEREGQVPADGWNMEDAS
ncbi:transposase [Pseudomonas hunanensis]|uniref:transposase n=1 Tax=Pseudomonas hunanensis TaxID=1247546 RepID=UPI00286BD2B0|nr:transposase [Pseudomonas hunanensis]